MSKFNEQDIDRVLGAAQSLLDCANAMEEENVGKDEFEGMRDLVLPEPAAVNFWRDRGERIIWIDDEIDASIISIVRWIMYWNKQDAEKEVDERKPIRIYFNSPGGHLIPSIAVCDAILLSKTPVYGYNLNECCSAAALIYSCCSKRFALPNAYFLLHLGSGGFSGSYQQTKAAQEDYNMRVQQMVQLYKKNLGIGESEDFDTLIDGEWYLYTNDMEETSKHNAHRYNLVNTEWTDFAD